ncbi:hypothetical protein MF271_19890 (plasmid) [Deinococcus sp. KNUC1210]|uniref:hypothetical protein n=1 Tax=Deinococcus sp. KNUC1210 TaxID=2917691 RepID=UPI001EF0C146|nr:hypothetical protein [Deinococcus sp. KNUC1210]ULH17676.1 hypothetical protein MF271_19890 [Deinococcus sp. KNUC1210]
MELLANEGTSRSATNPALSTGTLSAKGTFTVALPSAAAVSPYLFPACWSRR